MPSARTAIFGSDLKSRFGVNGIQYSSSDSGDAFGWSRNLNSAWPIVLVSGRYAGGLPPDVLCVMICLCNTGRAPRAQEEAATRKISLRVGGSFVHETFIPEENHAHRRPQGNQGSRKSRRLDPGVGPRGR